MLRRARRERATLVVGVDPVAAAMREASRSAARKPIRGGLANALFLVGSAEELPGPLAGRADEITVSLPWGSLLRGVLDPAGGTAERLTACLRTAGRLTLLLSLDRDALELLAADYSGHGFECRDLRPATADDVARLSGSWGRRLGIPDRQAAHVLELTLAG